MISNGRRSALPGGVAAAATAAALLAGCGTGGDQSSPTLPPLPSTSVPASTGAPATSATPPTSVTAGPPPRTPFTRRGAEQFVRAYYATANAAYVSSNTADLRKYTSRDCGCANIADLVDSFAAKGEHVRGTVFRILDVKADRLVGNTAAVHAVFSVAPRPLVNRAGSVVDHADNVRRQVDQLVVGYRNGGWVITRIFFGRSE